MERFVGRNEAGNRRVLADAVPVPESTIERLRGSESIQTSLVSWEDMMSVRDMFHVARARGGAQHAQSGVGEGSGGPTGLADHLVDGDGGTSEPVASSSHGRNMRFVGMMSMIDMPHEDRARGGALHAQTGVDGGSGVPTGLAENLVDLEGGPSGSGPVASSSHDSMAINDSRQHQRETEQQQDLYFDKQWALANLCCCLQLGGLSFSRDDLDESQQLAAACYIAVAAVAFIFSSFVIVSRNAPPSTRKRCLLVALFFLFLDYWIIKPFL